LDQVGVGYSMPPFGALVTVITLPGSRRRYMLERALLQRLGVAKTICNVAGVSNTAKYKIG